jgi:hypothetical protein
MKEGDKSIPRLPPPEQVVRLALRFLQRPSLMWALLRPFHFVAPLPLWVVHSAPLVMA